jgi:hypothetical protein
LQALQPRARVAYLLDTHLFLRWVHDIVSIRGFWMPSSRYSGPTSWRGVPNGS